MAEKPSSEKENLKSSSPTSVTAKPKKDKTPLLVTIIVILFLASAFLGWQYYNASSLNTKYEKNIAEMEEEITELSNMMKQNGLGDLMEEDIKMSLQNLLDDYNSVNTNNQELNDSISNQKERIVFLLEELESSENKRKYTAHELFKMKKEAETLRKVMKDYVHRVDSLNTLNQKLTYEIEQKDLTITEISEERDNLKSETQELSEQVELGGKLQILNLKSDAINVKRSGSFDETTRSRRADQVRACFTVVGNRIAKTGSKTFYMRVISPDKKVLTSPASKTISVSGQDIETSVSRSVDYQGNNVDLCIFYEKQVDQLADGTYIVEIYSEGILVGKSSFALK